MEKRHKFSIWYILVGVWIVLIIHNALYSVFSIETIPYSEFLQLVKKGRVAEVAITQNQIQEQIIFGDISTGAHNDLAKATNIATSMVKEYGMSKKVGQVYFSKGKQLHYLNIQDLQAPVDYSQAKAEIIDTEVREIINTQYDNALNILQRNKNALIKSAALLLEKESIDGDELKRVMKESKSEKN
jgi:ATP-dependent Zn protease